MRDFLLSYDDVCLRPKYSELESRSDADTSVKFLGRKWVLPVIPANMESCALVALHLQMHTDMKMLYTISHGVVYYVGICWGPKNTF